jgi:hypothetical protein
MPKASGNPKSTTMTSTVAARRGDETSIGIVRALPADRGLKRRFQQQTRHGNPTRR